MLKIENSFPRSKAGVHGLALLLVFLLSLSAVRSQGPTPQPGGSAPALGNATTAYRGNIWAVYSNPALLTTVPAGGAVFFSPSPMGLQELSSAAAVFDQPTSIGSLAAAFHMGGFELYRAFGLSFSIARRIESSVSAGITVKYSGLFIDRYGASGAFSIDAGIAVEPARDFVLGAMITNASRTTLGDAPDERLPLALALGLAYALQHDARICVDVRKDLGIPLNIRTGIEYDAAEYFSMRVGANTEPGRFFSGIGIRFAGVLFDYSLSMHPDLGLTHGLSLGLYLDGVRNPQQDTN